MSRFLSEPVVRILLPERLAALGLDHAYFELTEDFTYESDLFGTRTVKAGYISDLASIPGPARGYIDTDSPVISAPSIIHDWEYTQKSLSRQQCDQLLREAMLICGASRFVSDLVYYAVRLGGGGHW